MKLILVLTVLMSLVLINTASSPLDRQQAAVEDIREMRDAEILSTDPDKVDAGVAAQEGEKSQFYGRPLRRRFWNVSVCYSCGY